jgi:trimeric autotransporter adhesin
MYSNLTGGGNTIIGREAGYYVTGGGNVVIGSANAGATAYTPAFDITSQNNYISMGNSNVTNAYVKVAWTVTSDARDKSNFAEVPHGLSFVNQLAPSSYEFKLKRGEDETDGIVRYGFKAQDILALEGDNPVIIDNQNPDSLRYRETALIPILAKAIQELSAKNDALEHGRITALEGN